MDAVIGRLFKYEDKDAGQAVFEEIGRERHARTRWMWFRIKLGDRDA